jgi:hypothetical protein
MPSDLRPAHTQPSGRIRCRAGPPISSPKLTADAIDMHVIDRIILIPAAEALHYSGELARKEGIFVGITPGGTFARVRAGRRRREHSVHAAGHRRALFEYASVCRRPGRNDSRRAGNLPIAAERSACHPRGPGRVCAAVRRASTRYSGFQRDSSAFEPSLYPQQSPPPGNGISRPETKARKRRSHINSAIAETTRLRATPLIRRNLRRLRKSPRSRDCVVPITRSSRLRAQSDFAPTSRMQSAYCGRAN